MSKALDNPTMAAHSFLQDMYRDQYYPNHLVEKGENILRELCVQLEANPPASLEALYEVTQAATERFNDLEEDFNEADSEIETVARECIAGDFATIAEAYGYEGYDIEELIATRDW